jgi:hypothetical protein
MYGRCNICLEDFDPTEISALHCGHTFHCHCICQWLDLEKLKSCPSCRFSVKSIDEVIEQLFFDNGEEAAGEEAPKRKPPTPSKLQREVRIYA